jgi:murein tripeptide amidase MpaA
MSSLQVVSSRGLSMPVHPSRRELAQQVDIDRNLKITPAEIQGHLREEGVLREGRSVDVDRLSDEFAAHLGGIQPQQLPGTTPVLDNQDVRRYSTYDQVGEKLEALAQQYSELCERVSLGKSAQGREIWALRVGNLADSPETKPGVVITGCHHAREWMTVEIPLDLGEKLLSGYATDPEVKRRVDSSEIWIVPLVNPDGYEYSRTTDNWWRKTRRRIEETPCGPLMWPSFGVDPNRNYHDGKSEHLEIYRSKGDLPCSTADDSRATSDNPRKETYRGPAPASEPEVQTMLKLELERGNIKGVVDLHSYGEMILYPHGYTQEPPENVQDYIDVATKMNAAMGNKYDVMPATDLYPCYGTSNDIQHVNGIMGLTLEVGKSFQPSESEIIPTCDLVNRAHMVFIDEIIARHGTNI